MAMTPDSSASIQPCDMVSLATTNSAPGFSLYLRNGHDVSKLGAPKKSRQSAEGHFARIEQRRFWCDMVAFHLRDVSQHSLCSRSLAPSEMNFSHIIFPSNPRHTIPGRRESTRGSWHRESRSMIYQRLPLRVGPSPLSASQFRLVRHVSWKIVMYEALIR